MTLHNSFLPEWSVFQENGDLQPVVLQNEGDLLFQEGKSWLLQHGGFVHPALRREKRDGYFRIVSKQELKQDELLLHVPYHLCLSVDKFEQMDEINHLPLKKMIDKVAAVFVHELGKRENSIYAPWFQLLPPLSTFSEHPFFSTNDEKAKLEKMCSRVKDTIQHFQDGIDSFLLLTKGRYPRAHVEWAYINFMTRAFERVGLVPFCDLFNHSFAKGKGLSDNQEIHANQDILSGEEVFISYGKHYDSLELWLNFGFIDQAPGHYINCSNLSFMPETKLEQSIAKILKANQYHVEEEKDEIRKVQFRRDVFLNEEGPSMKMLELCTLLGVTNKHEFEVASDPEKTLNKLEDIIFALKKEIHIDEVAKFRNHRTLVEQDCSFLLKKRFELLKTTESWIKEQKSLYKQPS